MERLVLDELWELFQRLVLPAPSRPQSGGRRRYADREVLATIVSVATSGCAWRQPPSFGPSGPTAHRGSPSAPGPESGPGHTAWPRTALAPDLVREEVYTRCKHLTAAFGGISDLDSPHPESNQPTAGKTTPTPLLRWDTASAHPDRLNRWFYDGSAAETLPPAVALSAVD